MAMAPDSRSAAKARQLANPRHWQHLGQSAGGEDEDTDALWGECQGSALYQVRVDLTTLTPACSCPSRKQPCKHALALLLLAVEQPASLDSAAPPEWVTEWLRRRAASRRSPSEEATGGAKVTKGASPATAKRAEKRLALVTAGIEQLDLWLRDIARNGLGNVETQPAKFWHNQAAAMVDAQAPGIAARVRLLAGIPNSSPDWPEKLLAQLGQLALLVEAFRHLDTLDAARQDIEVAGMSIPQARGNYAPGLYYTPHTSRRSPGCAPPSANR
jgi:hypothetical protein